MKTKITHEERIRRLDAVNYARASISLEGFIFSADEEAHAQRFINGEIDLPEFIQPGLPGYTLDRVDAALRGKFDVNQLSEDEETLFMDFFANYMDGLNPESQAFASQMAIEGGYVGDDAKGRLVRTLPNGDVPPVLSSTAVWSPIPQPKEIGREEAFFRGTDHRLPA